MIGRLHASPTCRVVAKQNNPTANQSWPVKLFFLIFRKYCHSALPQITCILFPVHPTEGRIAIVTDAGLDAVDATAEGVQGNRRAR
jgi:hypothetical protein